MNIRGICCLIPGVLGLTDHVTVFSIVGRYLEHSRIYQFGRGEDARLYISSADFMTRNTERRVEIACPVLDPWCRRRLLDIADHLLADNQKARILCPDGTYAPREDGKEPHNCQEYFQTETVPVPQALDKPTRAHGRVSLPQRLRKIFWK